MIDIIFSGMGGLLIQNKKVNVTEMYVLTVCPLCAPHQMPQLFLLQKELLLPQPQLMHSASAQH